LKNLKWRALFVAFVILASAVYLVPTTGVKLPSWWSKALPKDKIHLGLDLLGGMHLVLEVEAEQAVENTAERLSQDLKETLRKEHVPFLKLDVAGGQTIEVWLKDAQEQEKLRSILKDQFPALEVVTSETTDQGPVTRIRIKPKEADHIRKLAVEQALEMLAPMAQRLENYQPYHAATADMFRRAGHVELAHAAYEQALTLTENEADRAFLQSIASGNTRFRYAAYAALKKFSN